jgi:predicted ATPase
VPPAPRPVRQLPSPRGRTDVKFGVINFKAIAAATMEPRRITVLAGANSSGKSSLLQSLLFLAQSYSEQSPVINGDLVRLGEPSDVLRDGTDDMTLEFSYGGPTAVGDSVDGVVHTLRLTLTRHPEQQQLVVSELSRPGFDGDGVCRFPIFFLWVWLTRFS